MFAALKKLFSAETSSSPADKAATDTATSQTPAPDIALQTIALFCQQTDEQSSPPPLLCYNKNGTSSEQWLPALSNAIAINQALTQLPESGADSYAICWLTELPHKESGELLPVLMVEAAEKDQPQATLYVQPLQNNQPSSQPVATGQIDNALTHLRQLPITPDQLPEQDQQKLPEMFCLPVTAIYLALEEYSKTGNGDFVAAMQRGQDRLAELAETGNALSQSLCQLSVNAMLSRTQASMLPSAAASFEQLLAHLEQGLQQLHSATQRGNFQQVDSQQFSDELLSLVDAVFDGIKDNQSYKQLLQLQQRFLPPAA